VKIQRERVHGLWDESTDLMAAGAAQFDPWPDLPFDINRRLYETIEEAGCLRVYTARIDGKLVGYAAFVVGTAPRRQYLLEAQQNVVHAEEAVKARVTPALVRHAEKALGAEGVKMVYHSSPMGCRFARLLEILGYKPIAQIHAKRLA